MDKTKLEKYAELKTLEKRVKAEIAELGPVIKTMLADAGADKVESDFGLFTLKSVPVWKYSAAVEEAEKKVDDLKADEKARGVAVAEPRVDLMFKAPAEKTV